MSSKLEYLKKYETKPAKDADKPRKKREKGEVGSSSFSIRDVSDALPEFKEEKKKRVLPGAERARPDEEDIEIVDMDAVTKAQKIDADTSGVKWKIQNHRPGVPRQSLDSKAAPSPSKPHRRESGEAISPPRAVGGAAGRTRHDSDADISPPRASGRAVGRARHDSDADLSPHRAKSGGGQGTGHDFNADLSPPRMQKQAVAQQPSLVRSHRRDDSDSDLSPRRSLPKAQRHDSDADLSPPRNTARGAPAATAQTTGRSRHDSDVDLSPTRSKADTAHVANMLHDSDADLSPPRNGSIGPSGSAGGRGASDDGADRMASGHRSGLVKASDLKRDGKLIRENQKAALAAAPDSETGRNAETVYRSKTGEKVDRETWASEQVKKRRKKASDYPEQELEWGGGVKQKTNADEEKKELERIAAQPFARYQPDEKFLEEQKDKHDWNDPMKQMQEDEESDYQAMGSAVTAATQKRPKCPFPAWANRFNIAPGYRWDGKVRSNGYEKKWLESKNSREFAKDQRWRNQELDVGN